MNYTIEIQKLRSKIERLREEIDQTSRARATGTEVESAVRNWVDRRAAAWRPATSDFVGSGSTGANFDLLVRAPGVDSEQQVEVMICALFGDQLKEALIERAKSILGGVTGVPAGKRPQVVAKLKRELDLAEIAEEDLIRRAGAESIELDRREDARPDLVLQFKS